MKPFKYTEKPGIGYALAEKIETEDRAELIGFLAMLPAETPVAWYSHKDEQGHPGAWIRRGSYRMKHGSFVDPSDLSCYAAQYYEAFGGGRHECLQIGRSLPNAAIPENAVPISTTGELIAAIKELAPLPEEGEDGANDESIEESELKLLQPDYAFEFHGALTRGWHAQYYTARDEAGAVTEQLIVLR